jgi:hypothetical protein
LLYDGRWHVPSYGGEAQLKVLGYVGWLEVAVFAAGPRVLVYIPAKAPNGGVAWRGGGVCEFSVEALACKVVGRRENVRAMLSLASEPRTRRRRVGNPRCQVLFDGVQLFFSVGLGCAVSAVACAGRVAYRFSWVCPLKLFIHSV